jgi:hypothetical protein
MNNDLCLVRVGDLLKTERYGLLKVVRVTSTYVVTPGHRWWRRNGRLVGSSVLQYAKPATLG